MADTEHATQADYLSAEQILANVKSLCVTHEPPTDAEVERDRRLPTRIVEALRTAGVFRMNMPAKWGGPEMTSPQQVEVIEHLSAFDASVGWCSFIWCDSGIYSGYLEDGPARALYPSLDLAQSGWIYPVGQAEQVPGGYRVSGRWMFGSGINHCDRLAAGCVVTNGGEPVIANGMSLWRIMLCDPADFEIEDTWHTTGLRGTGSHHYNVQDLFVPEAHSFSFAEPKRAGALWRRPDTLVRKMAGVPLGIARAALDRAIEILSEKTDRRKNVRYRDVDTVRGVVARAEGKLGAARAYVYESLIAQWQRLAAGETPSPQERVAPLLARQLAFQTGREVAAMMYDVVGGDAVYAKHGFDRLLRDANTACQHIVAQEKSIYPAAGLLLGADVSDELFL